MVTGSIDQQDPTCDKPEPVAATLPALPVVTPLSVATTMDVPPTQESITTSDVDTLHGVTPPSMPLPVVTESGCQDHAVPHTTLKTSVPVPVVADDRQHTLDASLSSSIPSYTEPEQVVPPQGVQKWSRISNKKLTITAEVHVPNVPESVPTKPDESAMSTTTTPMDADQPTQVLDVPEQSDIDQSVTDAPCKYYEVLSPEQDDLIYISHGDIMSNQCKVYVDKLTEKDIDNNPFHQKCDHGKIMTLFQHHISLGKK